MSERTRLGAGLASMVVFPVMGALRLSGVLASVPYVLVAGAAALFLVYALGEDERPPRPPHGPPLGPLLH